MYLPPHFDETRSEELHRLIRTHPLGALVVHGPQGLDANHLPFELDADAGERGVLNAHVARANPVWEQVRDGDGVLVIFRGPETYISPSWYPSKHEAHRQVPTWNYQVVHVHGRIRVRDDERFLRGLLARLTREHERQARQDPPWKIGDAAPEFVDALLKAIVGIEITIERIVGKSKLSQNKDARDRLSAAAEADERGATALAEAMRATVPQSAQQRDEG